MLKAKLIEETIRSGQGKFSNSGALLVSTGKYTGRATQERFIVHRPETECTVHWGKVNRPLSFEDSKKVFEAIEAKLSKSEKVYRIHGNVGGQRLEVHSLSPWHAAFADNMFRSGHPPRFLRGLESDRPIQILHDPWSQLSDLGVRLQTETIILLDPVEMKIAIVGTGYAGEIKKSAFSLSNYLLPERGVLSMHASANCRKDGSNASVLDSALEIFLWREMSR